MAVRRKPEGSTVPVGEVPNHSVDSKRETRPDLPCHEQCESLFSSRSGFHNYRGLLNNCIILLVLSNSRNVINNFIKYGILVNPMQIGSRAISAHWSLWILFLTSYVFPFILLAVEKLSAKGSLPDRLLSAFYGCYFSFLLLLPACYSYFVNSGPTYSFLVLSWYTIMWLKLVSYAQVNSWCRSSLRKGLQEGSRVSGDSRGSGSGGRSGSLSVDSKSTVANSKKSVSAPAFVGCPGDSKCTGDDSKGSNGGDPNESTSVDSGSTGADSKKSDSAPVLVQYPDNLNLKDMLYFLCAPTLCYELNFPRNKRRRVIFMLRRSLEIVFIVNVNLAIMQQWIMPTALHSLQPFKDMDWARMVERALMLALPNHLFWLLGFYLLFHSIMNLTGEILMFGDRKFYSDWWNAQTIGAFWKAWNIPVHRWATRHLYSPLKRMGYSSLTGQMAVFFLSAFFHEYLVSLPLQMIRPWAFVGMVSQIPLGILTALPFARGQIGNVIVWCSIILGQPVAILMYLHDYYWLNWSGEPLPTSESLMQ